MADEVGGEIGKAMQELINELTEARDIISGMKHPSVLGSKELAEYLEVDPKNLHHSRKTKFFPEPDFFAGNRPCWFLPTIQIYQNKVDEWRKKQK
ncbi:hypothetical protein [Paenibacillus pini]